MTSGVYERRQRTEEEKLLSLRHRLEALTETIPECGCHIFTGSLNRLGYGRIAYDKKTRINAHRAAYLVFIGDIPEGMDVLHKCDERSCIRPEHLWLGTHQENMQDMVIKGRSNRMPGSTHPNAKLHKDDVLYIRSSSKSERRLAVELGVSSTTVGYARRGINWKHV